MGAEGEVISCWTVSIDDFDGSHGIVESDVVKIGHIVSEPCFISTKICLVVNQSIACTIGASRTNEVGAGVVFVMRSK